MLNKNKIIIIAALILPFGLSALILHEIYKKIKNKENKDEKKESNDL
jgi:uncharacterized membrane protein